MHRYSNRKIPQSTTIICRGCLTIRPSAVVFCCCDMRQIKRITCLGIKADRREVKARKKQSKTRKKAKERK